jgi:hypothetical protein
VDVEGAGAIPASFLKPMLCDCVLERVLLAPNGAVLNLGRTVRTASPAQRRALHARDGGCVWPGCTIPARWCDVHHVPGWVHGSNTDIGDMSLLCGGHHLQVEKGHFKLVMVDGIPYVTPPAWIDPAQTPVRNTYWIDKLNRPGWWCTPASSRSVARTRPAASPSRAPARSRPASSSRCCATASWSGCC